jgi:hypothetical protein
MRTTQTPEEPDLRALLLRLLDEAYTRTGWTDRSLRKSLRGLGPKEAAWRPGRRRHNIWEQVVHLAYWKHVLHRRVAGQEVAAFPEKGRDWFQRDGGDERAWKRDRKLLSDTHARLRGLLVEKKQFSNRDLYNLVGAAFHDVYHSAQIELTRRLAPPAARRSPKAKSCPARARPREAGKRGEDERLPPCKRAAGGVPVPRALRPVVCRLCIVASGTIPSPVQIPDLGVPMRRSAHPTVSPFPDPRDVRPSFHDRRG